MPAALELIDTIVVVIMENRSFDHMLGYLNLPGPGRIPLEGLQSDPLWLQQRANSGVESFSFSIQQVEDPPHEEATIAIQIGPAAVPGGPHPMNGFVDSYLRRQPPPSDKRLVMGYYMASEVPVFDFLARHYTVCDRWFSALPTGTQANRLMAMSGTTSLIDNARLFLPDQPLVYDWLTERGISWCVYQSGDFLPFFALMKRWQDEIATSLALDALVPHAHPRFRRYRNFARDWASEQNMPSVIFIEPEYTDGPHFAPNDDHPPTGISRGQAFVADVYLRADREPGALGAHAAACYLRRAWWVFRPCLASEHPHAAGGARANVGVSDDRRPRAGFRDLSVGGSRDRVFGTAGSHVNPAASCRQIRGRIVFAGSRRPAALVVPIIGCAHPHRAAPRPARAAGCACRGGSGSGRAASAGCQRQCRGLPAGRRKNGCRPSGHRQRLAGPGAGGEALIRIVGKRVPDTGLGQLTATAIKGMMGRFIEGK